MKSMWDALVEQGLQNEFSSLNIDAASIEAPLTGEQFALAVLNSPEFRFYILEQLDNGKLPAAVVLRLMDYAPNWGKPPERIEHTGKDGQPIETITEVRRVIVRVPLEESERLPKAIH